MKTNLCRFFACGLLVFVSSGANAAIGLKNVSKQWTYRSELQSIFPSAYTAHEFGEYSRVAAIFDYTIPALPGSPPENVEYFKSNPDQRRVEVFYSLSNSFENAVYFITDASAVKLDPQGKPECAPKFGAPCTRSLGYGVYRIKGLTAESTSAQVEAFIKNKFIRAADGYVSTHFLPLCSQTVKENCEKQ